MNIKLLKLASRWLPPRLKPPLTRLADRFLDIYSITSYSQEGEDMILRRIFERQTGGFYVDVGAHHPRRFSNTYYFYRRGWRGINIEPHPGAIRAFQSVRPRDINLQIGVSDRAKLLTYYLFDETALNTFDEEIVRSRLKSNPSAQVRTIDVYVERLDVLLGKYLPPDQKIDFISIDVEGRDCQVLQSNDWQQYRPKCVLVEAIGMSLEDVMQSDILLYLKNQKYGLIAKTFNTLIFLEITSATNE
jgi:FkbM family methyltransferase